MRYKCEGALKPVKCHAHLNYCYHSYYLCLLWPEVVISTPIPWQSPQSTTSYASSCNYSTCVVLPVLLCTVLCCPLDYVQLEGRGYSSQSPSEPELNERNPNHTKTNLTYLRGTYSTKNWGCPKPLSLTSQKQESSWGENERDPRGY